MPLARVTVGARIDSTTRLQLQSKAWPISAQAHWRSTQDAVFAPRVLHFSTSSYVVHHTLVYSIVDRIWLCIFAIAKCIVTESVLLFISGMNLFKFARDSTFNFLAEHIIIVLHTMTDSQLIRWL